MAVCNNYKYLYQYITQNYATVEELQDAFTLLNTQIGSINTSSSGSSGDLSQIKTAITALQTKVAALEKSSKKSGITAEDAATMLAFYYKKTEDIDIPFGNSINYASGMSNDFVKLGVDSNGEYFVSDTKGPGYKWLVNGKEVFTIGKDGAIFDELTIINLKADTIETTNFTADTIKTNKLEFEGDAPWETIINNLKEEFAKTYMTESDVETYINNKIVGIIEVALAEQMANMDNTSFVSWSNQDHNEIEFGVSESKYIHIDSSGIEFYDDGKSTPVLMGTPITDEYINSLYLDDDASDAILFNPDK